MLGLERPRAAGNGSTAGAAPVQVGRATTWVGLTAGDARSCGTRTDHSAWCWGYNGNGEGGDVDPTAISRTPSAGR